MTRMSPYVSISAVVLLVFAASSRTDAAPIVTPTVTINAGVAHYDYSITNDLVGPFDDFVIVTINVASGNDIVTNLFAPAGFQASYDDGVAQVSFLADFLSPSVFPIGTTLSGFGFDSTYLPAASTFEILTLGGELIIGPTQAPLVAPTAIPEPATSLVLTLGLGMLGARRAARRRNMHTTHRRSVEGRSAVP